MLAFGVSLLVRDQAHRPSSNSTVSVCVQQLSGPSDHNLTRKVFSYMTATSLNRVGVNHMCRVGLSWVLRTTIGQSKEKHQLGNNNNNLLTMQLRVGWQRHDHSDVRAVSSFKNP